MVKASIGSPNSFLSTVHRRFGMAMTRFYFLEAHVLHLIRGTLDVVGMDWAVFLQVNAPEILEYK
jgi:hypothetical protein